MAVLAVDVGGTNIKLGFVEDGRVTARDRLDADADRGLADKLPEITGHLKNLLAARASVDGIGIAFPSLVVGQRIVGNVGKYRDAAEVDLAAWAKAEFGVRLVVENDARMAMIGEWVYGAARGASNAVGVVLGTGIGTGVVVDGNILQGRHHAFGMLGGHMTAAMHGRSCPCGNTGCWETLASTAALPSIAAELACPEPVDFAELFARSRQGDPSACKLYEHCLEVWGALGVSLVHAYDPEVIVFGGGVVTGATLIIDPIRDYIRRHVWPPLKDIKVEATTLGGDAPLLASEWLIANTPTAS